MRSGDLGHLAQEGPHRSRAFGCNVARNIATTRFVLALPLSMCYGWFHAAMLHRPAMIRRFVVPYITESFICTCYGTLYFHQRVIP
jgi:hypothetical protein